MDNVSHRTLTQRFIEGKKYDGDVVAVMKRLLYGDPITNHATIYTVKQFKSFLEHQDNGGLMWKFCLIVQECVLYRNIFHVRGQKLPLQGVCGIVMPLVLHM